MGKISKKVHLETPNSGCSHCHTDVPLPPLCLTLDTFLAGGMLRCSFCSRASVVAPLCLLFRGGEVRVVEAGGRNPR